MGYYDILLWGDDTEDERNARVIAKKRDSKINELLGTKEELEEDVIEEIIEEKETSFYRKMKSCLKDATS
jgi:hypothetical protein